MKDNKLVLKTVDVLQEMYKLLIFIYNSLILLAHLIIVYLLTFSGVSKKIVL